MQRLLLVCALLGLAAVSVSAQCNTAISGTTQSEACVYGTGSTAMVRELTITSAMLASGDHIVYIFNMGIDSSTNSPSWTATSATITPWVGINQLTLSGDYAANGVAYVFSRPGTYTVTYTPSVGVSTTARTGFYQGTWTGSATGSNLNEVATRIPDMSPSTSGTAVSSSSMSFLPLGAFNAVNVYYPSSTRRASVVYAFTTNSGAAPSGTNFIASTSTTTGSTMTLEHVTARSNDVVSMTFSSADLQASLRDDSIAPLFTASVAITFTDYPTLPSDPSTITMNAATSAAGTGASSSGWYIVPMSSPQWWTLTLAYADDVALGPHRAVFVTSTDDRLSSATNYMSDFSESSMVLRNPALMTTTPSTSVKSSPILVRHSKFTVNSILVRFEGTGNIASASTWTITEGKLSGECMTNRDCFADEEDHPARGGFQSSNKDIERFSTCVALPNADNLAYFTTKCVECFEDYQCNEGQYCHVDTGVCSASDPVTSGNVFWLCDPTSFQKAGRCMDRDPLENIVGERCTSDESNAGIGSSGSVTGTYTQTQVIASEGITFMSEDYITGTGFCGSALYFNESNTFELANSNVNSLSPSNLARTILWSGKCVNHECLECLKTDSMTGFDCINGRWKKHITVDNTIRTLTHNTTASGILAVGIFTALGLIAIIGVMVQAHMYRRSAKKEEADAKAAAEDAKALEELRRAEAEQARKDAEARAMEKEVEGDGESKDATVE